MSLLHVCLKHPPKNISVFFLVVFFFSSFSFSSIGGCYHSLSSPRMASGNCSVLKSRFHKSRMHLASLSLAHIPPNSSSFQQNIHSGKPVSQKKKNAIFRPHQMYLNEKTPILRKKKYRKDWFIFNTVFDITVLAIRNVTDLSTIAWAAQQDLQVC